MDSAAVGVGVEEKERGEVRTLSALGRSLGNVRRRGDAGRGFADLAVWVGG